MCSHLDAARAICLRAFFEPSNTRSMPPLTYVPILSSLAASIMAAIYEQDTTRHDKHRTKQQTKKVAHPTRVTNKLSTQDRSLQQPK